VASTSGVSRASIYRCALYELTPWEEAEQGAIDRRGLGNASRPSVAPSRPSVSMKMAARAVESAEDGRPVGVCVGSARDKRGQ